MLLACPNCDARYDVPDSAIPEAGRDVQCSNCGNAWFQLPAGAGVEDLNRPEFTKDPAETIAAAISETRYAPPPEEPHAATPEAAAAPPEWQEEDDWSAAESQPEPQPEPPELSGTDALKAALTKESPEIPAPVAAAAAPPVRRELDDAVLEILRDEAEREASARKAEAQRSTNRRAEAETGLQSQPELSITPPTAEMTAQQKRLAMLRGEDLDDPEPEPSRPMARRDLLPDVEEINSTLQPDDSKFDPESEIDSLPDLTRGSFRTGFLLAVLALVIAALIYVFADRISTAVPSLESTLNTYVSFVDNLRNWLNSLMDSATQALTRDETGTN